MNQQRTGLMATPCLNYHSHRSSSSSWTCRQACHPDCPCIAPSLVSDRTSTCCSCNTARTSTEPFCHCRGCRLLVDGAGRAQTSMWRCSAKTAHICLGASALLALRFRSYFAPSFSFAAAVPSCVVCASRSSVGTLVCASRGCFFGMPCQQPI